MEPGGEDHAAGAGRHIPNGLCQVIVETGVHRLLTLGHILLLEIDADLVQCQVVLHPLQALPGSLHFSKVVVPARLCSHNGGNHGSDIHLLVICHCGYPAGGTAVDVSAAQSGGPGSHTDEGGIPTAAEHRCAGYQP